jgi:membrane protein
MLPLQCKVFLTKRLPRTSIPADPFPHEPTRFGHEFANHPGMLARLQVPLGWTDLLKRTGNEALEDSVLDLAAQQAYYFFFALFPALLFVIAIASFFPLQNLIDDVVQMLARVAPQAVIDIVKEQMTSLGKQNSGGLLTFAFLVTIWSSSGAMVSIITTLNAAYDITESRPWWKTRIVAIGLTVGIAIFILASMFLVLAGPSVAEHLATTLHLGAAFKWTWWVLQWPIVFALVVTAIGLVYYFAPDAQQDWVWITPGSVLAAVLWIAASLGLKLYYTLVPNANATYGTIGGVMVLMLWFYCSGIALLMGAELNAEIEHASPYGKDPGERVPGEKKVIGARAQRIYEEKRAKGEIPIKPMPQAVNCDIDRPAAVEHPEPKPSELLIGTIALIPTAVVAAKKIRDEMKKTA